MTDDYNNGIMIMNDNGTLFDDEELREHDEDERNYDDNSHDAYDDKNDSSYKITDVDLSSYTPIADEKGFNGSRYDFKRTKPLFTDEQFKKKPLIFRVGAILSDGQWYDVEKLRRVSHHNNTDDVQNIIDDMMEKDMIVSSDSGESYRMTYQQMVDWRSNNGIPLDAQIVQSILYPRIIHVGNKSVTEQEVFLPIKRHKFGSVKFMLKNVDDINEIKKELCYIGRFVNTRFPYKWQIICLSADWCKKKLEEYENNHGGKGSIFADDGRPNIYNNGFQRDLNEIDPRAIEQIVRFYQTFQTVSSNGELRPAILQPSSYRTMKVYLDDGNGDSGVMAQLNAFIIDAIQHYDEKCGSPFAAYLQMIVNRRVNDIPKYIIGEELAKFQNNKAKAVKALNKDNNTDDTWYTDEQIIDKIREIDPSYEITPESYADYDSQLKTWQQTKHTTGLQWDETGEEKRFDAGTSNAVDRQGLGNETHEKNANSSRIQHAIIHAAVLSGKAKDARIMLAMLNNSSSLGAALISSMSGSLSDEYRDSLAISLSTLKA